MTENTLDANICIQQLLQLVVCFRRKQVSGPWLPGGKLLGETVHMRRYVRGGSWCTCCGFCEDQHCMPEFIKWAFCTLTYRQLTRRFNYSTGTTQTAAIHVSGYDLPGLGAGRDSLEMWQGGWSHCYFWLVLPRIVPFVVARGKGLLKGYVQWSEECKQ